MRYYERGTTLYFKRSQWGSKGASTQIYDGDAEPVELKIELDKASG